MPRFYVSLLFYVPDPHGTQPIPRSRNGSGTKMDSKSQTNGHDETTSVTRCRAVYAYTLCLGLLMERQSRSGAFDDDRQSAPVNGDRKQENAKIGSRRLASFMAEPSPHGNRLVMLADGPPDIDVAVHEARLVMELRLEGLDQALK